MILNVINNLWSHGAVIRCNYITHIGTLIKGIARFSQWLNACSSPESRLEGGDGNEAKGVDPAWSPYWARTSHSLQAPTLPLHNVTQLCFFVGEKSWNIQSFLVKRGPVHWVHHSTTCDRSFPTAQRIRVQLFEVIKSTYYEFGIVTSQYYIIL